MANSNSSFDDVSPSVIPTPSTHFAPSYPLTPSLVPTLISPILPSVDNILAGETFLPCPPSLTLLDPTPIPPILRNDTGVTDAMVSSSPPLSPSTKDVIAGLVSLPSQLTPEFLEPTPPEVPLDVVPNGSSSSNPAIASIAPVYPSSSPILPSTADVLKGDVFLPSQPSMELMEPTYSSDIRSCGNSVSPDLFPPSHTSSLSPSSSSESSSGSRGSKVLEHDSPALSLSPHDSPTQQHQLLGSYLSNHEIATGLKPTVVEVPSVEKSVLVAWNAQDVRSVELLANDVKLSGNDLRHKIRGIPGDKRLFLPNDKPVVVESQSDTDDKASRAKKKAYLANIETTIATLKAVFRGNKTNPILVRDIPDSSIQENSSNSNAETSTAAYDITRDIGCIAPPAPISSLNKPTRHLHHPVNHRRIVTADIEHVIAQARPPPPTDGDQVTFAQSTPAPSPPHSTEDEDDAEGDSDPDGWIPAAQERLARLIEVANPPCPDPRNTPPALDPDLKETVEPDDLNSCQDLLLPDSNRVRLEEFRSRWFDTFAADSSWSDFTCACEQFAAEARQLAQDLLKPDSGHNQRQQTRAPPRRPPPPPMAVLSNDLTRQKLGVFKAFIDIRKSERLGNY